MASPDGDGVGPDLAAAIHETTNALTVILGWIERARQSATGAPEVLYALQRAARHTRGAREQMRQTIGAQTDLPAPERASALAKRTVDDLQLEAQSKGVQLLLEEDAADGSADASVEHPTTVWRILINLLLNAIAASPAGAAVSLFLDHAEQDTVRFRVRDEGRGIEPERRGRIFLDGASTRAGGAGIGLRHSHELAQAHGAELRLLDSPKGACFELCWPLSDAAPVSAAPRSAPPRVRARLDGLQVLLLEDDAAVVELLELSLMARGAELTTVTTAPALDAALESRSWDVLLVDLSPLQGEGSLDQAVDKARTCNPDLTVVAISGSVSVQPRADVLWVRKPFSPGELTDAILERRRVETAGRADPPDSEAE